MVNPLSAMTTYPGSIIVTTVFCQVDIQPGTLPPQPLEMNAIDTCYSYCSYNTEDITKPETPAKAYTKQLKRGAYNL